VVATTVPELVGEVVPGATTTDDCAEGVAVAVVDPEGCVEPVTTTAPLVWEGDVGVAGRAGSVTTTDPLCILREGGGFAACGGVT